MRGPLRDGERALFLDGRDRRYLVTLKQGQQFHTHAGYLSHDEIIGVEEGTRFSLSSGAKVTVVRPTLSDVIVKMPRGAQVVYPKDIGSIIVGADIAPGVSVLEAGTGSGALTMALVRAVGSSGKVVSLEQREDHARRAEANIVAMLGSVPDELTLLVDDITTYEPAEPSDRLVLDLPEPWQVAERAELLLRPGGIFCAYIPSTTQVQETVATLRRLGFIDIVTSETLIRTWHVEGRSVRPDHRMVGHTGFLTIARLLAGTDTPSSRDGTDPNL
jgi:tRNA (adenine57-N1/adenine58-N1)-methyltransferase catalytic subunit